MAEAVEELSVAELQKILRKRQSKVGQLHKKREKVLQELSEIDQQIAELSGSESGGVRFKNAKSLEKVICEVLARYKKGLDLAELTAAVEKTGYQSGSANFKNVVYQNVYKSEEITRDEKSGKYVLA